MIMVPAQNFYKHQENYDGYGGWGDSYNKGSFDLMNLIGGYDHHYCNQVYLGSDPVSIYQMAEEGSRTSSTVNEEEADSSSKGVIQQENNKDDSWLQLGLGNYGGNGSSLEHNKLIPIIEPIIEPITRTGGLVELDLLPKPLAPMFHTSNFRPPSHPIIDASSTNNLFLQYPRTSLNFPQQHEITWGYSSRPNLWNPTAAAGSSSSSMLLGSSISRSFQYPRVDIAGPSSDNMRVVDAPSRPHSGIWFVLQASQNQAKEPFLPQIPKSYLRIKDERMTVRLLMKYLVNKLRLNSESEVEITCRGQQLQPFLTLQHVRDNIWRNSSASASASASASVSRGHQMVTLLPDSSTTDHVMILHYGHHTNNGGGGF